MIAIPLMCVRFGDMREFILVAIGFFLGAAIGVHGLMDIVNKVVAQFQGIVS